MFQSLIFHQQKKTLAVPVTLNSSTDFGFLEMNTKPLQLGQMITVLMIVSVTRARKMPKNSNELPVSCPSKQC